MIPPATSSSPQPEPSATARPSRREFLRLASLGFVATYTLLPLDRAEAAPNPFFIDPTRPAADTFGVSVASGDPTPTGVLLWTRVNPTAIVAGMVLGLEVAMDVNFIQVVVRARVPANQLFAGLDYTVRVDLNGQLQANTRYFYRFIYNGTASRTGRARTLPAPGDATFTRLKLAVVNCQDYTNGYYASYAAIAADATIDYVLHIGDFIYETTGSTSFQDAPYPDRRIQLPSSEAGNVALNLEDYRLLYRTYRSDANLRAALENFTWMTIWDDHEMANDQYHDYPNDSQGAPDHPYASDPTALRQLKFQSQQAWFEYNAARVRFDASAGSIFGRLAIYRSFRFGELVELFLTDERTYRTGHPNGEGEYGQRYFSPANPLTQNSTSQKMLGDTQLATFVSGLSGSTALWKGWANEVLLAPLQVLVTPDTTPFLPPFLLALLPVGFVGAVTVDNDAWDGYQNERRNILTAFKQAGVKNLVVLTGDLHSYVAAYAKVNYGLDPTNTDQGNLVGVEFMSPAITSSNLGEQLGLDPASTTGLETLATTFNQHIRFFNSSLYGYATVEFSAQDCVYTMFQVDKSTPAPPAPTVLRRFRTPVNQILIEDITSSPTKKTRFAPGVPASQP